MILKHFELKNNLQKKINYYLLYGPNTGLIEEKIDTVFKPAFSKNVRQYEESDVLINQDSFKEEIFNKSFFDNEKFIIINRSSDKILNLIKEIIVQNVKDIKIVIKAGALDKRSKLRSFFEKDKNTIIAAFYEDNHQSLLFLVQNFFKEKKINISNQNINLIIERSQFNRVALKNELAKISNYCELNKKINQEEILKITNLAENHSISELTDQCLIKNKKKTFDILNENNSSAEDNIIIIRNFLYKLKRLKKLKENINDVSNVDNAISLFKPPIFWKDKNIIKQQLKILSLDEINEFITKINDLENLIKRNSQISNLILNNFIIESLENSNNSP